MNAFGEKTHRIAKKFRWENEQGEAVSKHVSREDAVAHQPADGKYYQLIKSSGNGRGMEIEIMEIGAQ